MKNVNGVIISNFKKNVLYCSFLENVWREIMYRYFCKVYKLLKIEEGNKKEIIKLLLVVVVEVWNYLN